MLNKMKKVLKKPSTLILNLNSRGWLGFLSDEQWVRCMYRVRVGKKLNLGNPKGFNEKLQWLKLYDRNPEYTKMVDKCEAKKYVAALIGEEYIIPTLGVYDSFDEIDFDSLPNRFVIKCTHNSGGVTVVNNKKLIDKRELSKKFEKILNKNYYNVSREWPYKNVVPRIIVEENIQDSDSTEQINDYKLMCFDGKVKCSFVCSNRNSKSGLRVNFYDEEWKPMPFERHYPKNPNEIEKPSQYEKMVELAEILSKDIPFVRVDLYQQNDRIYFGELTFYPGGGMEEFTPEQWDYNLGEWINLLEKNR